MPRADGRVTALRAVLAVGALPVGALAVGALAVGAVAMGALAGEARADVPARFDVSGVEAPARPADAAARDAAEVALFLPRNVIDYTFLGTELAASLVADEQLVPRYRELLGTPGGDLFVFPTLFAETGSTPSVGLRMIADSPKVASSQRFGFGGPANVAVESRVVYKGLRAVAPYLVSVELAYRLEDDIEFHGLGISPRTDPRNRFRDGTTKTFGLYSERRVRWLASYGVRPTDDLELFLSSSLYRRQTIFDANAGEEGLFRVFETGSVAGFSNEAFLAYSELAARYDSRRVRTRPAPGVAVEAYFGGAHTVTGSSVAYARTGARATWALPFFRQTNLVIGRFVIDHVEALGGHELPFVELSRQPDYRGFDTRRDALSLVLSLDYAWQLVPFLGMRLFLDGATVAPGVSELELSHLAGSRIAGGLGFDFFAGKSALASFLVAASPDGARVTVGIGGAEIHGDRQHRD